VIQSLELDRAGFLAEIDRVSAVYAAAMHPDPAYLPGRASIMERHTGHPGFRALAVTAQVAGDLPIIAFGYGFRGASGQWWHDVVRAALTARVGEAAAGAWLDSSIEIAELHVHPDFQRRGIGRSLLLGLTAGRQEHTAALSTQDDNSPARRLYRSVGFADLLTGFSFPGGGPPYTVMGAVLPLRPAAQGTAAPDGGG
jgi:ribosomal protein S18 acetylase RimI-like enzyme